MEVIRLSETSNNFQRSASRYIPEDITLYIVSNGRMTVERGIERIWKNSAVAWGTFPEFA
jgi:hypothetical protein